jgi:hypothetical protein
MLHKPFETKHETKHEVKPEAKHEAKIETVLEAKPAKHEVVPKAPLTLAEKAKQADKAVVDAQAVLDKAKATRLEAVMEKKAEEAKEREAAKKAVENSKIGKADKAVAEAQVDLDAKIELAKEATKAAL